MQFKTLIAAATLAVAAAPSFALVVPTTLSFNAAGVASFSNVAFGDFVDTFQFVIGNNNDGTAVSATNVALDFGFITNFAGTLAGTALTLGVSTLPSSAGTVTVQTLAGATGPLAPGLYQLSIRGNAGDGASYGGSLIAITAAVPEPETTALLLAGLGAVCFVVARRNALSV